MFIFVCAVGLNDFSLPTGASECRTPIAFSTPMHVVVGRPIELKKNPLPTIDEVKTHNSFTAARNNFVDLLKTQLFRKNIS
jgi:hypothetical protein